MAKLKVKGQTASTIETTNKGKVKSGQTKPATKAESKKPNKAQTTYKRGTLGQAIYAYFDACVKAKKDPNYEESLAIAQKIMPGTKYQKTHYAWYKNKYKQTH